MIPKNAQKRKLLASFLLSGCLILLSSAPAKAWGDYGHRIVARIASKYLTAKTKSNLIELLRADIGANLQYYQSKCPDVLSLSGKPSLSAGESDQLLEKGLACVAPWPDPPLKDQRLYTSNWHFVDIPVNLQGQNGPVVYSFDVSRDCRLDEARGDCAILAVRRLRPILSNAKQDSDDFREQLPTRAEALKFIVHIIGDLHQPLHCITDKKDPNNLDDLGDIGGNWKIVEFNVTEWENNKHKDINPRWSEQWNLHSVWDEGIIDATMALDHLTEDAYVTRLLATLTKLKAEDLAELQAGDLPKWVNESYQVAIDKAYNLPEFDKNYKYKDKKANNRLGGYHLDNNYYLSNRSVVEEQLKKGGLRLAKFLNDTFEQK